MVNNHPISSVLVAESEKPKRLPDQNQDNSRSCNWVHIVNLTVETGPIYSVKTEILIKIQEHSSALKLYPFLTVGFFVHLYDAAPY